MPSSLAAGQAALNDRKKLNDGRTVTYTRGAASRSLVVWTTGTPAQTMEVRDPRAAVVSSTRDYLFTLADYLAMGLAFPPKEGDRITDAETDPATGQPSVFALAKDDVDPAWRWSDESSRTRIRVHCRRA